jgi:formylglycine-generating enzyme required for sulfatase activity
MTRRALLLATVFSRHHAMVRLPGGAFRMGSDENSLLQQFPNAGPGLKAMLRTETPACDVFIPPFWIDRYEVTNAQFRSFVLSRAGWRKERIGGNYLRHWSGDEFPPEQANHPVTFVTWEAATVYAEWARKRLPTEAEWEFAARGGRQAKYPWGNQEPDPRVANYRDSGIHAPVRAGSYPPNPYGIFDLAGNVWEFCLDPWKASYSPGPRRQSEFDVRTMRSAAADRRVIRGGSFDGGAFNMRVTARDSHPVNNPVGYVGFRCARSA